MRAGEAGQRKHDGLGSAGDQHVRLVTLAEMAEARAPGCPDEAGADNPHVGPLGLEPCGQVERPRNVADGCALA